VFVVAYAIADVSSLGVHVTLILNILHEDMSILAADQKAIAQLPATATPDVAVPAGGGSVAPDYNKITLNPDKSLALGVAGRTIDHYYTQSIWMSVSIDEVLWKIRKHMEGFLRVNDRTYLSTLSPFTVNQSIATFFDQKTGTYFSNTFMFSPVHNQTRLHRAKDEVQIFRAGSGSEHFEQAVGEAGINSFIASTKNSCTPEACIPWMQDAFRRVSACDAGCGAEAVFVVSTRANPKFHSIE
jgi:hypothetical protein